MTDRYETKIGFRRYIFDIIQERVIEVEEALTIILNKLDEDND